MKKLIDLIKRFEWGYLLFILFANNGYITREGKTHRKHFLFIPLKPGIIKRYGYIKDSFKINDKNGRIQWLKK